MDTRVVLTYNDGEMEIEYLSLNGQTREEFYTKCREIRQLRMNHAYYDNRKLIGFEVSHKHFGKRTFRV